MYARNSHLFAAILTLQMSKALDLVFAKKANLKSVIIILIN